MQYISWRERERGCRRGWGCGGRETDVGVHAIGECGGENAAVEGVRDVVDGEESREGDGRVEQTACFCHGKR